MARLAPARAGAACCCMAGLLWLWAMGRFSYYSCIQLLYSMGGGEHKNEVIETD
eukprot:COSAG05_NODE_929_length_6558_cov_3.005264_7_plen_54_part_00